MADKHAFFRVHSAHESPCCPVSVPWEMIAPFEGQAQANHQQSLDKLHHRGGLSPMEIHAVMNGLRWRDAAMMKSDNEAALWLVHELSKFLSATATKTGESK